MASVEPQHDRTVPPDAAPNGSLTRVHCRIPIEVRLHGRVDPDRLTAAIAAAAHRRLAQALRIMHQDNAIAGTVTVEWSGTDPGRSARSAIHTALESVVADTEDRSPAPNPAGPEPVPRISEPVAEPYDPARDLSPLDGYLVDSYGSGGAATPVPAHARRTPVTDMSTGGFLETIGSPDPDWSDKQWAEEFFEAARLGRLALRDGMTAGLLYRTPGGFRIRRFEIASAAEQKTTGRWFDFGFALRQFRVNAEGEMSVVPVTVAVTGVLFIRGVGDTATPDARAAVLRRHIRAELDHVLTRRRARATTANDAAKLAEIEHDTLARLSEQAATSAATARGLLEFVVDDRSFLIPTAEPASMHPADSFPVVPYRILAKRPPLCVPPPENAPTPSGDEPFEDEPPLSALGEDAAGLRQPMAQIARILSIPVRDYAGRFAVEAATALGTRVRSAATIPALSELATAAPHLTSLRNEILRVYAEPAHACKNRSYSEPASWALAFLREFTPTATESVVELFGTTCQVLLLDAIDSSRRQLQARRTRSDDPAEDRFSAYAATFEQVLLPRLRRQQELIVLLEHLQARRNDRPLLLPGGVGAESGSAAPDVRDAPADWHAARANLLTELGRPAPQPAPDQPDAEPMLWPPGLPPRIVDRLGRSWSEDDLRREIAIRRTLLESADPLIKQLVDLPEVLARFADPERGVRGELGRLLDEMLELNREQRTKVAAEWQYAFRIGRIVPIEDDDTPQTVAATPYTLIGIHLQAHEAISDAFGGSDLYASGLDYLFRAEHGRKQLLSFIELAGLVGLSVLCPPLGAAVNVVVAVYHTYEAAERENLYRSLLDPDAFLSLAEIETELFAATLGAALALIPEATALLRGAMKLGAAAATEGAAVAVRTAARTVVVGLAEQTIQALERELIAALVTELVKVELMQVVVARLMQPMLDRIEQRLAATGPTPDLNRTLTDIEGGR
ncbi:hypothetical protein [Nocardia thraciensis]